MDTHEQAGKCLITCDEAGATYKIKVCDRICTSVNSVLSFFFGRFAPLLCDDDGDEAKLTCQQYFGHFFLWGGCGGLMSFPFCLLDLLHEKKKGGGGREEEYFCFKLFNFPLFNIHLIITSLIPLGVLGYV